MEPLVRVYSSSIICIMMEISLLQDDHALQVEVKF